MIYTVKAYCYMNCTSLPERLAPDSFLHRMLAAMNQKKEKKERA